MWSPPERDERHKRGEDGDGQRLDREKLQLALYRSIEERRREAGVASTVDRNEGRSDQE
jgi:hypothetical protein